MFSSERSCKPIMIKHMESQASLAKSNHQVDSNDWRVAGMKIRHRNGLIMKSSVGGWLLIVHVNINVRFRLLI